MLSKRSSIEYMKLIFIKIYSETQERKRQSYRDDGGVEWTVQRHQKSNG